MALSERDRRELHAAVELHLGSRAADLLLAMNEPELPFVLRAEMAELRGEMAELRSELKGEMAELRSELKGEMAGLRIELKGEIAGVKGEIAGVKGEIAGVKGEVAELRGEMQAQLPKFLAANFAAMVGVAGVVVAAGVAL